MNIVPTSRLSLDSDEAEALRAIGWQESAGVSSCPDSTLLLAAEDEVLDAAVAARVRAHVAACPTCRMLTDDLASLFGEGPSVDDQARIGALIQSAQKPARRFVFWWLGAAGLAAAAASVMFVVVPLRNVADLVRPAGGDTVAGSMADAGRPTVFQVDRPAVAAGEIDLTVRGEAATAVSLANRIGGALDEADAGNLRTAVDRLRTIVRDHPRSRDAQLALGATLLRDNQSPAAVETLQRARAIPGDRANDDEVDWYLTIGLVRAGAVDRARQILGPVCDHGGSRSARACAGVAELSRRPASR